MSNKDILEKAIKKAIEGGWEYKGYDYRIKEDFYGNPFMQTYTSDGSEIYDLLHLSIFDLIYNHDFAKALWGEENFMRYDGDTIDPLKKWQWNLQQMVIADDPIKYLGENI